MGGGRNEFGFMIGLRRRFMALSLRFRDIVDMREDGRWRFFRPSGNRVYLLKSPTGKGNRTLMALCIHFGSVYVRRVSHITPKRGGVGKVLRGSELSSRCEVPPPLYKAYRERGDGASSW